jgi:hypothetical protein
VLRLNPAHGVLRRRCSWCSPAGCRPAPPGAASSAAASRELEHGWQPSGGKDPVLHPERRTAGRRTNDAPVGWLPPRYSTDRRRPATPSGAPQGQRRSAPRPVPERPHRRSSARDPIAFLRDPIAFLRDPVALYFYLQVLIAFYLYTGT